jgi:formylglycine-generating enzyme
MKKKLWNLNRDQRSKVPLLIIALITAILFSFIACEEDDGSDSVPPNNTPIPIVMLPINGGTFTMGSPTTEANRGSDETQHSVTLGSFSMSKYQITQWQWVSVMGDEDDRITTTDYGKGINYPIYNVSWYDALVFCNKLSQKEELNPAYSISGKNDPDLWGPVPTDPESAEAALWNAVTLVSGSRGYRLPTEAQWEYACRAGTTTAYNTGDTISVNTGWYTSNSGGKTHEVGMNPPNAWGLNDMHGNVSEFCWDWYGSSYYSSSPTNDPMGPVSAVRRVVRGGSWRGSAESLRSAKRSENAMNAGSETLGFRVVRPN